MYVADSPENCHLNVKKFAKNCHIFQKNANGNFFFLIGQFLAIFLNSNGSFLEGQVCSCASNRNSSEN